MNEMEIVKQLLTIIISLLTIISTYVVTDSATNGVISQTANVANTITADTNTFVAATANNQTTPIAPGAPTTINSDAASNGVDVTDITVTLPAPPTLIGQSVDDSVNSGSVSIPASDVQAQ